VVFENGVKVSTKMPKLKRNIDSRILDRFWELVDASDEKRSRAAEQLLSALLSKQPPVYIYTANWPVY